MHYTCVMQLDSTGIEQRKRTEEQDFDYPLKLVRSTDVYVHT